MKFIITINYQLTIFLIINISCVIDYASENEHAYILAQPALE